jgi:hypothetical protein
MPEVGLGAALERFELTAQGEEYCVIDIVDQQLASITLTALPEFPLRIDADLARQFVGAWEQRANMQGMQYQARHEQREV